MERDFKGIWIPKEIYLNDKLNWTDKILLLEIDSLDNEEHCFASNAYFAKFINVSENAISQSISKLEKNGYIKRESFDGRKRVISSNLKNRLLENSKADFEKIQRQDIRKLKDNNIYNNTNNNKEITETKVSDSLSKNIEFLETQKTEIKKPDEVPQYFIDLTTKMVNSNNILNKIIAEYWLYKGRILYTKEQVEPEYKRELQPAKALKGYSIQKIKETFKKVNQYASNPNFQFNWTLETVGKMIVYSDKEWENLLKPKNIIKHKEKEHKEQTKYFKNIDLKQYAKW